MSTVPEVIVAAHAGLRMLALSTVTNMCLPDALSATAGAEVVRITESAKPKLRSIDVGALLAGFLRGFRKPGGTSCDWCRFVGCDS